MKTKYVPNKDDEIKDFIKSGRILIFKVKKELAEFAKGEKIVREKSSIEEVMEALRSEIENEIAKIALEKGEIFRMEKKNIGFMVNEIFTRLRIAHPSLASKIEEKRLKKMIANLIIHKMSSK